MPSESPTAAHSFDLVPITKAKQVLGIAQTTIYGYIAQGFRGVYKIGKARKVSKSELLAWITSKPTPSMSCPKCGVHFWITTSPAIPSSGEMIKENGQ